MKKTLLIMVMALAVLLTQCRKPEVKFPSPVAPEGTTVSMTVTAGPGSKTDITTAGGITWSTGDKLYVGFDGKYVGCLTLTSGQNTPTGWFSGNVTLPKGTTGENTFGFFYLGNAKDYSTELASHNTYVDVSFASQEIYNNGGKLENASKHHVGYGSAKGTVAGSEVTGINVTLVSKVALARFSFTDGTNPYTGELTLSGTHIYNSMTVNFGGTCTPGTNGNISLAADHAERYVMLVPPTSVSAENVTFKNGNIEGGATFNNGIEANKFYGQYDAMAVTVKAKPSEANASASAFNGDEWNPKPKFSVGENTTVEFSPGNLYWDGSAFRFEANQWDYSVGDSYYDEWENIMYNWDPNHVSHFFWSNTADWQESGKQPYAENYSYSTRETDDVFFTEASDFQVNGYEANTWRTLSKAEWDYLLNSRDNASSLHDWVTLSDVSVSGLVLLPDGSTATASGITTSSALAGAGAVFLPAAGCRYDTGVGLVGSDGCYWSSTPFEGSEYSAYYVGFYSGFVDTDPDSRNYGEAVRLVR